MLKRGAKDTNGHRRVCESGASIMFEAEDTTSEAGRGLAERRSVAKDFDRRSKQLACPLLR